MTRPRRSSAAEMTRAVQEAHGRVRRKGHRPAVPTERPTPEQYVRRHGPPRRLDRLVLIDIAAKADWSGWTWGQHAYPRVSAIADRIGYCERSVQYALRRLVADGYLEIVERPGRTHNCRVLRHLHAVAEDVATADPDATRVAGPGDASGSAATAPVAPGGAKVAPDLVPLPGYSPPDVPQPTTAAGGLARSVGPDGPAHSRNTRPKRPGCARHPGRAKPACRNCQPTPVPPPPPEPVAPADPQLRAAAIASARAALGAVKGASEQGGGRARREGDPSSPAPPGGT